MGYSTTHYTGNAAGYIEDNVHIFPFAYKKTKKFIREADNSLEKITRGIVAPFVFLGNAVVASFIYKVDNKYIEGTPEYKKRMSKIKVIPNPRGFGVIIEYSE